MNEYLNFIGNFSTLHSYYILNKRCNSYFKPQKMNHIFYNLLSILPTHNHNLFVKYFDYFDIQTYFNKNFVPESIIKKLINKIKEKKILITTLINFDISKTREEKELFLRYLIKNYIISLKRCLMDYSFSEDFFQIIKRFLVQIKDDETYFIKSHNNLSNKWILNNLDKIPVWFFYEDRTRIFSQDEISQILDYYKKNPNELIYLNDFIAARFLNKQNLEKLNNIIIKNNIKKTDIYNKILTYY